MYKSIETPAQNSVVVNGTLLSYDLRDGKSSAAKGAKPFRSASAAIRVTQTYGGKSETSEIPVNFIAMKFKKDATDNPIYETLGKYNSEYRTATRDGLEEATHVSVNGRRGNGSLSENMFADSRNPENVISNWNIGATFLNEVRSNAPGNSGDCATFDVEIFILNMDRELTAEGEETGRLKIRGGLVKYGRKIDCLDFYVEDATAIDYIERNYNVNDTARFVGRIRYTSEVKVYETTGAWGESIPQQTTDKKRELVITGPGAGGEDGPYQDEEKCYDPEDIRVLIADRNALKEQKKMEARNKAKASKATESASSKTSYEWEE